MFIIICGGGYHNLSRYLRCENRKHIYINIRAGENIAYIYKKIDMEGYDLLILILVGKK